MATTVTKVVQRVEVYGDKRVMVVYELTIDDPNDNLLPATSNQVIHLNPTAVSVDDEGVETTVATDLSSHDELVQTICTAVWAE